MSISSMKNRTVFLLGFLSLSLFSCGFGKRASGPSTTSQATLPQTLSTETMGLVAYNCQYIGGHQIVGDYSCSKRFCYTFSWCQGRGSVFLFCEAALNAEGKYSCPPASACAGSKTVPDNPALAPYLWKNNCDGGGGGYEDDEEEDDDDDEEEDKSANIPNDRGP